MKKILLLCSVMMLCFLTQDSMAQSKRVATKKAKVKQKQVELKKRALPANGMAKRKANTEGERIKAQTEVQGTGERLKRVERMKKVNAQQKGLEGKKQRNNSFRKIHKANAKDLKQFRKSVNAKSKVESKARLQKIKAERRRARIAKLKHND